MDAHQQGLVFSLTDGELNVIAIRYVGVQRKSAVAYRHVFEVYTLSSRNIIPDGLKEIADAMPAIMSIIARTARWAHPEVFKALPVWRPDTARTLPLHKADWITPATNKGVPKEEGNVNAQVSLLSALGVVGKKPRHWTTCHIWGYDDPRFAGRSRIIQDRRYFSCIGNMVLLPTPLKGFTDAVPEIKRCLRVCAYYLYG